MPFPNVQLSAGDRNSSVDGSLCVQSGEMLEVEKKGQMVRWFNPLTILTFAYKSLCTSIFLQPVTTRKSSYRQPKEVAHYETFAKLGICNCGSINYYVLIVGVAVVSQPLTNQKGDDARFRDVTKSTRRTGPPCCLAFSCKL